MSIINFGDFIIFNFFSLLFGLSPKVPHHTCGPFPSYWLKIAAAGNYVATLPHSSAAYGTI
jgi:hypothetical protein